MSNTLIVARKQPSYLMAPVISVKADLVTQNENYIYVPLASRTTYGSVMIGEGLNIDGGVLSFDKSEVSILTIAKNGEDIVPDENKRINITIDKTDVGLSDVDNTSDADKPVSILQQIEFDKKIDIYQGKEYSERALVVGEDGYVQPRAISITLDKDVVNKISVGGQDDAVNIGYTTINLKSLVEKSSSVGLPLATDTRAGLMSSADYASIRDLQSRMNRVENRASKLFYDDTVYPTSEEINAFVESLGYVAPFEGISVLVSGTHHIWHYYENAGWIDDGIDIVDQFTNTTLGVIKGSSVIGKIYAETDGTGSVNGWDSLVLKLEGLENASDDYVKKQGYQEVAGPIVFVESLGIKNEDGTIDYIKHINNNLLITTSTGTNLLNIDEGLSKVYFFNKEIAFKSDIGESSGTTVKVGGVAVAEFNADTKADASTVEQLGAEVGLLDASVKSLGENVSQQGATVKALDNQLISLATQVATDYYNKTDADGKFATKTSVENKAETGKIEFTNLRTSISTGVYTVDLSTCSGLPDMHEEEVGNVLAMLVVAPAGRILITSNGAEATNHFYYMAYNTGDELFNDWTKIDTDTSMFVRNDTERIIIGSETSIAEDIDRGVAIGFDTDNTLENGVSVGVNIKNNSWKGVAIGSDLQTSGNNSIVIGNHITNTDKANIAIGGGNTVSGEGHVAIGLNSKVSGDLCGVAVGNGSAVGANYAIQLGVGTNNTANTLQIAGDNIYNHETHTMSVQNLNVNGTDLATTITNSLPRNYEINKTPSGYKAWSYKDKITGLIIQGGEIVPNGTTTEIEFAKPFSTETYFIGGTCGGIAETAGYVKNQIKAFGGNFKRTTKVRVWGMYSQSNSGVTGGDVPFTWIAIGY